LKALKKVSKALRRVSKALRRVSTVLTVCIVLKNNNPEADCGIFFGNLGYCKGIVKTFTDLINTNIMTGWIEEIDHMESIITNSKHNLMIYSKKGSLNSLVVSLKVSPPIHLKIFSGIFYPDIKKDDRKSLDKAIKFAFEYNDKDQLKSMQDYSDAFTQQRYQALVAMEKAGSDDIPFSSCEKVRALCETSYMINYFRSHDGDTNPFPSHNSEKGYTEVCDLVFTKNTDEDNDNFLCPHIVPYGTMQVMTMYLIFCIVPCGMMQSIKCPSVN
jgi:hypothetical protein